MASKRHIEAAMKSAVQPVLSAVRRAPDLFVIREGKLSHVRETICNKRGHRTHNHQKRRQYGLATFVILDPRQYHRHENSYTTSPTLPNS